MGRGVVVSVLLGLAACGRSAPPRPVERSTIGGDLIDPGTGSDDVIVATVNGRPVWGSCVAGHMRARGVDKDQALKDCIDLELLAAAALERGVLADPDTQADLRAALVDGFVTDEFEDKTMTASDLPAGIVDQAVQQRAGDMNRPEIRLVVYARAVWRPNQGKHPAVPAPDSPEDAAAHALADAIYAKVVGRDDVFPDDLYQIASDTAAGKPIDKPERAVPVLASGGTEASFTAATFGLPAIGTVSAPVRTPWGWDLILLTDIIPAQTLTRDELVAQLFPAVRRAYFDQFWAAKLEDGHDISEADSSALAADDDDGGGAGSGSGAAAGSEPAP